MPLLRSAQQIRNAGIHALDGDIGEVHDILFDDSTWEIRYLVVDTSRWLLGRKVLIPPEVVLPGNDDDESIRLNLTKEQIKNSPDIETDRPVSEQMRATLAGYYGWATMPPGGIAPAVGSPEMWAPPLSPMKPDQDEEPPGDPHLRSTKEVIGYHILTADGELGQVEDVAIERERPAVAGLIADTRSFAGGREVLIPVSLIREIDWLEQRVKVRVATRELQEQPEVHPNG